MDEVKVGLNVEDGEEKKEGNKNDMEVSGKDVNRMNDGIGEDRINNTKEEIPKNLSFIKGVVESVKLLPLNVNR